MKIQQMREKERGRERSCQAKWPRNDEAETEKKMHSSHNQPIIITSVHSFARAREKGNASDCNNSCER